MHVFFKQENIGQKCEKLLLRTVLQCLGKPRHRRGSSLREINHYYNIIYYILTGFIYMYILYIFIYIIYVHITHINIYVYILYIIMYYSLNILYT